MKLSYLTAILLLTSSIAYGKPAWIEHTPEGYAYFYHVGIGESTESMTK